MRRARACDGTGDENIFVGCKRHEILPISFVRERDILPSGVQLQFATFHGRICLGTLQSIAAFSVCVVTVMPYIKQNQFESPT